MTIAKLMNMPTQSKKVILNYHGQYVVVGFELVTHFGSEMTQFKTVGRSRGSNIAQSANLSKRKLRKYR